MNYKAFISTFKKQTDSLPYNKGLDFAIKISKELLPEYVIFSQIHNWGNPELLKTSIELCERARSFPINRGEIAEMAIKIEEVTPHMDDFGDLIGSYALNACIAVYYSLQFLIDKAPSNIYNIGISYTDTVDFKVQGEDQLTEEQIEKNPEMIKAWNFIVEESR